MITKQILKQVIEDQSEQDVPSIIIPRKKLDEILASHSSKQITILTGIRRCGKSIILQEIRKINAPANYYINFDDERLIHFDVFDFQMLMEVFLELFGPEDVLYFDEIQNISSWERFMRRLYDQGKKVYITGSNANLLSDEFGTHLTGRHIPFSVFPFSFSEYCDHLDIDTQKSLHSTSTKVMMLQVVKSYLKEGGFPYYLRTKEKDYLRLLYDDILYRDIIVRYQLPNDKPIRELSQFVASNVGKEMSFSQLKNMLGLSSPTTVKEYFNYLEKAYLIFILNQYSPSLKKQAYMSKKAYFVDTAMTNLVGFRPLDDHGGYLENVIFVELKRRGLDIFFHKGKKECDFLIRKGRKITDAIQVSFSLDTPSTKNREVDGLRDAMETHNLRTGTIITLEEESTEGNITIIPAWKWLLDY